MSTHAAEPPAVNQAVRRWPRCKLGIPLRLITERPRALSIVEGRGTELNCGGMTVFAAIEFAVNEQIAVEFVPPESTTPIRVRCFIRNRNGFFYGVEFITENDLDYEHAGELEGILQNMFASGGSAAP